MKMLRRFGHIFGGIKNAGSTVVILIVGSVLLLLIVTTWLARVFGDSFFLKPYQRINIGMWGKRSIILSYNLHSPDHTLIFFTNNYEIEIPGGLRGYTVGSIGRLVSLEKKQVIYKKALSSAGQVLIHKTLHDATDTVYFDDFGDISDDRSVGSIITSYIFGGGELNIFERLFLFFHMSDITSNRTSRIILSSGKQEAKLYEKIFRNERKLVQIKYKSSVTTAYEISSILENIGIRVADVVEASGNAVEKGAKCAVVESAGKQSETAKFLASYFECKMMSGDTGLYNIHLTFGDAFENEWGE